MGIERSKWMTLSSTEYEHVSSDDTWKEILFIHTTLNFVGMKITLPIEVKVENMGESFLSQNSCGKRICNIESRNHFVYEYM